MQKLSICQGCGTIVTRMMPRCAVCGAMSELKVLYEFIPDPELEAEDLEIEEGPYEDTEDLLDLLFDAYEQIGYAYKDRDHYENECKAAGRIIDKQIKKVKDLEGHIKELRGKLDEALKTPEEPKKKGLFK